MRLRIWREPLLHFLIIGLIIYSLMNALAPTSSNVGQRHIKISSQDLISFMQQRDQVFDAELYARKFSALDDDERRRLMEQYAEQEVLYREAKNLGLDQNDEILRRRLIQKLKYFLEGLAQSETAISEAELEDYYLKNKSDYQVPASITFTHVFFKQAGADPTAAVATANNALAILARSELKATSIAGDSFPYHRDYIKKTEAQIARHFGTEFATQLFTLSPDEQRWQGPLVSAYGAHLVQVSALQPAFYPDWQDIATQLQRDLQRIRFAAAQQSRIDQLVEQYKIELVQP